MTLCRASTVADTTRMKPLSTREPEREQAPETCLADKGSRPK